MTNSSPTEYVPKYNPGQRFCYGCAQWLDLDNFHKRAASPDGRQPKCKTCAAEYQREYRRLLREQRAAAREAAEKATEQPPEEAAEEAPAEAQE